MSVISVRIDKELEEKLTFLMEKQKIVDKSAYIRKLLGESIKKELLDFLSKEIESKNLSIKKAAELAQMSLKGIMHELAERGVKIYDETALQEDLIFAEKEKGDYTKERKEWLKELSIEKIAKEIKEKEE